MTRPPRPPRPCSDPDCDRPARCKGLCVMHYNRARYGKQKAATPPPPSAAELVPLVLPCPDDLVPIVTAAADIDARAIVRLIWPHLLEAHLAGLEPFTLEPVA